LTKVVGQLAAALVGRFTLERELGRGGMATVYLARDLRHDRLVALKVLHPELGAAMGAERFRHEIETAARLEHPHILPVFDSGEAAGQLWYTMPYVQGESLRDRLRRQGQLPIEEALRLIREAADGLDNAHQHGVIHRDIKPENILLSGNHARVADFGIARALEAGEDQRLTATGVTVGTPAYMSPEQASGARLLDGRSDVYSLGCVLYELLAGEAPFTGPTPQAVIARRFVEPAPPVRRLRGAVPANVEAAIARALAREPADRFQSAAEFARALGQPSSAPAAARGWRVGAWMRPRRLVLAAVTLLLLVAVGWLAGRLLTAPAGAGGGAPAQPREPASIAVLPFRTLGPDPQDEYLSDGITEDLINTLGKVPNLRVLARTSAFTFKGRAEDVRQVGTRLNVGAVVEGSLRRIGDTLRVTAQLVNVADGYQLWAERYDRPSAEILSLEDDLARAIVRALQPGSTVAIDVARTPTDNPEAYKLYLKGRYHVGKLTEADERTAIRYFDQAIGLDPTFALAYSGLADAYGFLYSAFLPPSEGMPKAKAAARRALELDPTLAEAYASLGNIQMWYDWEWRQAEEAFQRAVSLNPNYATARHYYGQLLVFLGRIDEAGIQLNLARQLDPLSLNVEVTAIWPLVYGRRYDEAIDALRRTVASDSTFPGAQFLLAYAYAIKGEFGLAEARLGAVRQLIGDHPDVLGRLGYVYARSGQRQRAEGIADSLRARYRKGGADEAYALAVIHGGLTEKDRALDWLEQAYADRSTWMNLARVSPELDALRSEPRFKTLLARMRLD
jgi:serine/threonine-protein kinase